MFYLIKNFLKLFVLQVKPEDIVYSKLLLAFLINIDFIVNYKAAIIGIKAYNLINKNHHVFLIPSFTQSIIVLTMLFLVLAGFIYSILMFKHKTNRFVQILTSIVAVDILLRSLIIGCVFIFKYSPVLAAIIAIPVIYWEFVLYIFIFSNGFSCNYLKSGIFSLFYMLIQHNLGELFFSFVSNKIS